MSSSASQIQGLAGTHGPNAGVGQTATTLSRRQLGYLLLSVAVLQMTMLAISLPATALFAGETFWYIDHPYHRYQIELGRALAAQGLLTGYDPFFAGGYIAGVPFNASAKFPVLLAQLLPASVGTTFLYTAYVVVCSAAGPLMVPLFAWNRRWTLAQGSVACLAGLSFWWCSAFRWYDTAGMVSFVFCCYFGITYAAWIWRLSLTTSEARLVQLSLAAILGSIGCWLHPFFPIIVVFVYAGYLCTKWRCVALRRFIIVAGTLSIFILVTNAPWIASMFSSATFIGEQPYQRAFGWKMLWQPLLGQWSAMGTFLNPLSIGLCILAALVLRLQVFRELPPLVLAGLAMLTFSAFGGAIPAVAATQPNRFAAPAFLLLGLAASHGIPGMAQKIRMSRSRTLIAVGAFVSILVIAYTGRELQREISSGPHGHYGKPPPQLTAAPEVVRQLADWISANTTDDARILFETSLGRIHGGGHIAGMLSLMTRREMVGGPYPFMQSAQSFWDRIAFGQPIGDLSGSTFRTGLDHFNIGWIVAHTGDLQRFVVASGTAKIVKDFGSIKVYEVERIHSFAESGTVTVHSSFNHVEIDTIPGRDVVLRYNWAPGLKVTPPATIEPFDAHPGFPPLIHVIGPPAHFVLSTCERCLK